MATPTQNAVLGMSFMLTATLFWSGLDVSAKVLIDLRGMPDLLVVWVRLTGGLVASYFVGAAVDRRWDVWRVNRPWGQFWRSFFMTATTVCNFTALGHLPITTTISIFFCAPLILAALSQPVLGERVGRLRWAAIGVGFCGVLVVMQPWGNGFSPWMLVSFSSAVFFALMQLTTRQLASHDSAGSAVFYTTSVGAVALVPLLFLVEGNLVLPGDRLTWALFLLVGMVFGTAGHMFNVLALHYADAVRVAPFFFLAIVWTSIAQALLFGGGISPMTILGTSIIIGSGLFVFWREARAKAKSLRAARPPL
jgi:drug/metabolite transporter (DMT)-like permease